MKFISPLIKITDTCNFNCKFCYYAQKQSNQDMSKKIMPLELTKKIIKETCEYNLKNGNNQIHLIFHGGEPMLAGIDYFNEIIEFENQFKKKYPEIIFNNSIQTNGYCITDRWVKFYKDNDFGVSVSIDGENDLNFHQLKGTNKNSNEIVLNNLKKLIDSDVYVTVMSVITNKHIGKELELYNFYKKHNIKDVAFCFCYNKDSDDSVDPTKLGIFLKQDSLYVKGTDMSINEFDWRLRR